MGMWSKLWEAQKEHDQKWKERIEKQRQKDRENSDERWKKAAKGIAGGAILYYALPAILFVVIVGIFIFASIAALLGF